MTQPCLHCAGGCSPVVKILPQTVPAGCCKANGNEETKSTLPGKGPSVVHLLEKEASQNFYLRFIKVTEKETVSCVF